MESPSPSLTRPCDGIVCLICSCPILVSEIGYRVAVPSKRLSRLASSTISSLAVRWDLSQNTNYFHMTCWKRIEEESNTTTTTTTTATEAKRSRGTRGSESERERERNGKIRKTEMNLMDEVTDTIERFDPIELLIQNARIIAEMIKSSRHTVAFTGAGISAAAGISTYRGADGLDTIQAYGGSTQSPDEQPSKKQKTKSQSIPNGSASNCESDSDDLDSVDEDGFSYRLLRPTYSHRALTVLYNSNYLHYCITQNCDDLHHKGGLPRSVMNELHGNVFCEYCERCFKEYYRNYSVDRWSTDCSHESWYVECPLCHYNHYTSRLCSDRKCNGKLRDTIVNFSDDLHEKVLGGLPLATRHCKKADLCIAIGSSLTVYPACYLPVKAKELVIINLQVTELDEKATVRCWGNSDLIMKLILSELHLPEPQASSCPNERESEREEDTNSGSVPVTAVDVTVPVKEEKRRKSQRNR